ncbi:toll/interleukin-1 receptor domain-containing protein [Sphingomonas mesophila]|uniref:toll/interleukin-1 receptor domain-containing protein n=1 Tax=Sphingomonas mesophila TaxID=2303576 RepID=UPI0013C2D86B|nr:toll/interleukin-1 receptor domain-containing protein [Sphingomonas mesophila]
MNRLTPIVRARGSAGGKTGGRRYWAFLSYAHADARAAARLHSALERFRVPPALIGRPHPLGTIPRKLSPVFRDRQELAAASNLSREIGEALDASSYLVVLCSPAAARSKWVDQEIREFQRRHGTDRTLAAILDGEPGCGEDGRECFPPALREEGSEPIAADLRASGDGWRGGFLKIVAGMLDVGLDEIVQRDQQRRQKRMAWIAAASFLGMASTSGLALFALDQRNAAREERREAEGLVEFMLGDLKSKLEPIGKLDALDGVGTRILRYYAKQDAAALDDAGLLQRSRALSLTAQVAYQRGDVGEAERLYRQAMAGTAEAVRRKPDEPQRLFDHAQNVFWIGELARSKGRLDDAVRAHRDYQRLADEMVRLDPADAKWRLETVYARQNLGIVLYELRRFDDAAERFARAHGALAALVAANPVNDQYRSEYSTMLAWLADARRDQGRLAEATGFRQRQVDMLQQRLTGGSANVEFQEHLIPARRALGILLHAQGRSDRAIATMAEGVRAAERLIAVEPDNGLWRQYAAGARLELASTLTALRRTSAAAGHAAAGCALAAEVRRRDPEAAAWRQLATDCLMNRARIALAGGDTAGARSLADQALASARGERNLDVHRPRYRIAAALRLAGDIANRSGDRAAAERAWADALGQLPANITERPRELAERVELLSRVGLNAEAARLTDQLKGMGYDARI